MEISCELASRAEVVDITIKLARKHFKIPQNYEKAIRAELDLFLVDLVDSISFIIEFPYTDKLYRDSYYNYFSSKLGDYPKETMRVSIFDEKHYGNLKLNDFLESKKHDKLRSAYRGFLIIRPTFPRIIGRNVISPKILKEQNLYIRWAEFSSTVFGIKFKVKGFPHSSQDNESISCSETCLWATMEYFSNRYAEYRPSLPSHITSTLKAVSFERQLPSNGLVVSQLSFALREYGFGTKIYSKNEYKEEFFELFSCYVESGIPVILAIEGKQEEKQNGNGSENIEAASEVTQELSSEEGDVNDVVAVKESKKNKYKQVGHANVCIGRESLLPIGFDSDAFFIAEKQKATKENANGEQVIIYDNDSIPKKYVFIDDNFPRYSKATLNELKVHENWKDFLPTHFIAPIYKRVHLEAGEARKLIYRILLDSNYALPKGSEVFLRIFLASSRSYKDNIANNDSINPFVKLSIMTANLPKFIWVGEISSPSLIKNNEANGMIILDATEADTYYLKPLILLFINGKIRSFAARLPSNMQKKQPDNEAGTDFAADEGDILASLEVTPFKIYSANLESIEDL